MKAMLRWGAWLGILTALVVPAHVAFAADGPVLVVPTKASMVHVTVDLPAGWSGQRGAAWELVEQSGSRANVSADVLAAVGADGTSDANRLRLAATISRRTGVEGTRRFELRRKDTNSTSATPAFSWRDVSAASVRLTEGKRPVLVYNYGDITNEKVPKRDFRRTRGCYVHPIYGLDGEALTDDFPRDHYHHHGLFWAWPHVEVGGKAYDLWQEPGMEIRFVQWLGRHAGTSNGTLGVENGWFVGEKKVVIERVWFTAHPAVDGAQAIDMQGTWLAADRPVTLLGREDKSYGGVTIRFAVPRGQRGTITVPDGVTRSDLAVTRLPWADLSYAFAGTGAAPSGATLMVSKSHPDYPPTWLTRHYGPLCIGYPGVVKKTLAPGEPMTLRYRLWIHKGAGSLDEFKAAYDAYAAGESARWEERD